MPLYMSCIMKLLIILSAFFNAELCLVPVLGLSQGVIKIPDTIKVYTYNLNGTTASGLKTNKEKKPFLALSRDLIKKYPLHSKVFLYRCSWQGEYNVLDIMGPMHKNSADIFYKGKRKNVEECLCVLKQNRR